LGYFGYDYYYGDGFSCGLSQENIIKPEETSWTYRRDICEESYDQEWDEDLLSLNLMSMDNNYFDYFIKFGEVEFSSSTIGEGGSGRSFGIDGGIGVFGSVGIDRHRIPMIP